MTQSRDHGFELHARCHQPRICSSQGTSMRRREFPRRCPANMLAHRPPKEAVKTRGRRYEAEIVKTDGKIHFGHRGLSQPLPPQHLSKEHGDGLMAACSLKACNRCCKWPSGDWVAVREGGGINLSSVISGGGGL